MISNTLLIKILNNIAITIKENKEYLTHLDSVIGDSDHGFNMNKGFKEVRQKLESLQSKDCGTILKNVAMTLISKVGGASGPLYGTAFLKSSVVIKDKYEISEEDSIKMFDESIKGIISRGKAKQGDKTMLDALIPAYQIYKDSINKGDSIEIAISQAQKAAYEGVEYTKKIKATKGRASYLGDRSIGHQDPGATSSYLILKSISDTLNDTNK